MPRIELLTVLSSALYLPRPVFINNGPRAMSLAESFGGFRPIGGVRSLDPDCAWPSVGEWLIALEGDSDKSGCILRELRR